MLESKYISFENLEKLISDRLFYNRFDAICFCENIKNNYNLPTGILLYYDEDKCFIFAKHTSHKDV